MKQFKDTYLNYFKLDALVIGNSNFHGVEFIRQFSLDKAGKKVYIVAGPCGSGKSHIIGALGNKLLKQTPQVNIHVLSYHFENAWLIAESCDLLIIEDVGPLFTMKEFGPSLTKVKICLQQNIPVVLSVDSTLLFKVQAEILQCGIIPTIIDISFPEEPERIGMAKLFSDLLQESGSKFTDLELTKMALEQQSARLIQNRLFTNRYQDRKYL